MLSKAVAPTRVSHKGKGGAVRLRSSSDDSALKKQVQGTHNYDGREVDVESILVVVKNILNLVSPGINGFVNVGSMHLCLHLISEYVSVLFVFVSFFELVLASVCRDHRRMRR